MPIQPINFPMLNFEQTNPLLAGGKRGMELIGQNQDMLSMLLAQQKARAELPYIGQQAQAKLGLTQAKIPYTQAQTGILNKDIQWYDPKIQALMKLQQAQTGNLGAETDKTRYMLNHPGFMGGNSSKDIQYFMDIGTINKNDLNNPQQNQQNQQNQPYPSSGQSGSPYNPQSTPEAPFKTKNNMINAILNRPFAQANYQNKMAQGYTWAHLPVETKNNLIAQGVGMGIDPIKMSQYVNDNLTLPQIAEKEGLDPNNLPSPVYFPTATTKTRVQQQQQVGAELNYMSSRVSQLIKPYANTFLNFSPKALTDQFSSNPNSQKEYGKYMGALALQNELNNGRVLLSGGHSGIEIIKDLKNKSLAGIDQRSPVKLTKIMYEEAQKTIDSILQKGSQIRQTTGMNPFSKNVGNNESSSEKEVNWKRVDGQLVRE